VSKLYLPQVEVGICRRCVNSCAGCNHMSALALPPFNMPVSVLREDLLKFGQVAQIGKLSLLGGEPTLHPEIDEIIAAAQWTGVAGIVSLITNGQLLDRMSDTFWRLIRKIELDVYPGKLTATQVAWVRDKAREHGIDLLVVQIGKFYKCLRSGREETPEQVQRRFDSCPTGHLCVCLDYGHVYRCPQASIIPPLLLKDQPATVDGLALEGITVERLKMYLESRQPLKSCARCSVQESWFNWHETTRERWLEESTL
jgi:hypothetical protein